MKHIREFNTFINEIGTASAKSYSFSIEQDSPWVLTYEFTTESGLEYHVRFDLDENMSSLSFYVANLDPGEVKGWIFGQVTNRGELYKVMSTIVKIINEFIKKYPKIDTISIAPTKNYDEDNRRYKLYLQFINKNIDKSKFYVEATSNEIVIIRK